MTAPKTEMVFCKECETPALATLDNTPYCTRCLLRQIKRNRQKQLKRFIQPLTDFHSHSWQDRWPAIPISNPTELSMA
ncbi:MAG: hypothetical protein JXR76_24510 [Deltaproteobacteria bacterium]|nr:hypothetical protein [Deltaproteobacteria bacterium]